MSKQTVFFVNIRSKVLSVSHPKYNEQQLRFFGNPPLRWHDFRRRFLATSVAVGLIAGGFTGSVVTSVADTEVKLLSAVPSARARTIVKSAARHAPGIQVAMQTSRALLPSRHSQIRPTQTRPEHLTPPQNWRRAIDVKVTAYTPINTTMEGGRWTSTLGDGRGTHGVAVDPRVIRLGSRLWIPGYGYAVADDIGGGIRGNHVDIRVQEIDHMGDWGTRNLKVYVLEEPE